MKSENEPKKIPVSITLDETLIKRIDELAEALHRKRSDTINLLLSECLDNIQIDSSGGTGFIFKRGN